MKFPIINGTLDSQGSFIDALLGYDKNKIKRPLIDFNPTLTSFKVYTTNVLLSLFSIIEPTRVAYYDECGKEAEVNFPPFFGQKRGARKVHCGWALSGLC
jgi:hypothetical protein